MASFTDCFTELCPVSSTVSLIYGQFHWLFHWVMASFTDCFTELWPVSLTSSLSYGQFRWLFHWVMASFTNCFTELRPVSLTVSPSYGQFHWLFHWVMASSLTVSLSYGQFRWLFHWVMASFTDCFTELRPECIRILKSALSQPLQNCIRQSLRLDLANINAYAKFDQNTPYVSTVLVTLSFTFSQVGPWQSLFQWKMAFGNSLG